MSGWRKRWTSTPVPSWLLFGRWTEQDVFFVTRLKESAAYEVVESFTGPLPRKILADELIRFTGVQALKNCPCLLRRVVVWDEANIAENNQNLAEAIRLFGQVVSLARSERALAAQAQYRQAPL